MSNLNPGGLRAAPFSRIFVFEAIKRHIQQHKPDHSLKGRNSIATGNRNKRGRSGIPQPHEHRREIARRQRQAGQ